MECSGRDKRQKQIEINVMKNKKNKSFEKVALRKKEASINPQKKLDQEQHYDIDGITRDSGKVVTFDNLNTKKKLVRGL